MNEPLEKVVERFHEDRDVDGLRDIIRLLMAENNRLREELHRK